MDATVPFDYIWHFFGPLDLLCYILLKCPSLTSVVKKEQCNGMHIVLSLFYILGFVLFNLILIYGDALSNIQSFYLALQCRHIYIVRHTHEEIISSSFI